MTPSREASQKGMAQRMFDKVNKDEALELFVTKVER